MDDVEADGVAESAPRGKSHCEDMAAILNEKNVKLTVIVRV